MAENQLILGLKRQYGRTLGFIRTGEDRAEDLAHLAAVIRMFSPDEDLTVIKPIRPYPLYRERWNREALAVLRGANAPMTAREIAKHILTARGMPLTRRNLQRIECSLYPVLGRLEGYGVVCASEEPRRWAIEALGG